MSGADVPYHLRPNKFVDRQLFIDLLSRVGQIRPLANYVYSSMGGKFLEDHRALHMATELRELVSIDENERVVARQNFNKPFESITCLPMTAGSFVDEFPTFSSRYPAGTGFVTWLDYTAPKDRLTQLQEFSNLVSHLQEFDIVKITLNANVETLGGRGQLPAGFPTIRSFRLSAFQKQLSQFPSDPTEDEMVQPTFPRALARSIGCAAQKGIEVVTGAVVYPLAVLAYRDGTHTMLSSACIVLSDRGARAFTEHPAISDWLYRARSWGDVSWISVPDLSVKEKLHIDRLLRKRLVTTVGSGRC